MGMGIGQDRTGWDEMDENGTGWGWGWGQDGAKWSKMDMYLAYFVYFVYFVFLGVFYYIHHGRDTQVPRTQEWRTMEQQSDIM